ncbi:hypothetical protein V6N13_126668 [Hibiscus sabdariffa]|uniref:Leucine-rich repeat-containing N-terminal plant-type domain-containing protein n=1 Tax=Hibiscus sabdariffa TaxID=183260 RepID=A0ABR2RF01_9ROSI
MVRLCESVRIRDVTYGTTDPNDLKILNDFKQGLDNPELLKWPETGYDPCGHPPWPHVFRSGDKNAQIQVQNLGLKGPLPQNLNQHPKLFNLGLQKNHFNGKLPTFSGLSELEFAYLDNNDFDTIPAIFSMDSVAYESWFWIAILLIKLQDGLFLRNWLI